MAAIVLAGVATGNTVAQAILFAILGAFLQTAVLGLLYEVLLRDEVENATLEKLNLSADVKRHGLIKMDDDATVDWEALLDQSGDIFIVTSDPGRLLGSADNRILERLKGNRRRRLTIAVPKSKWDNVEKWVTDFEGKWRSALPEKILIGLKLEAELNYELISAGDLYVVLLPPAGGFVPGSARLLEFRDSGKEGIGCWLKDQLDQMSQEQAAWGHAPPKKKAPWAAPAGLPETKPEEIS